VKCSWSAELLMGGSLSPLRRRPPAQSDEGSLPGSGSQTQTDFGSALKGTLGSHSGEVVAVN
jgi:hypothetical protein